MWFSPRDWQRSILNPKTQCSHIINCSARLQFDITSPPYTILHLLTGHEFLTFTLGQLRSIVQRDFSCFFILFFPTPE